MDVKMIRLLRAWIELGSEPLTDIPCVGLDPTAWEAFRDENRD
jgi:hypothetical protein